VLTFRPPVQRVMARAGARLLVLDHTGDLYSLPVDWDVKTSGEHLIAAPRLPEGRLQRAWRSWRWARHLQKQGNAATGSKGVFDGPTQ
jgi:hypothetical protein